MSLGKILVKSQKTKNRIIRDEWLRNDETTLKTIENKLESVTFQNDVEKFFYDCQLSQQKYIEEGREIKIIDPNKVKLEQLDIENSRVFNNLVYRQFISIPKRPEWNYETTPSELKQLEINAFNEWLASINQFESEKKLLLTPFERNLEVWRQLWRVVEKSDLICQIVDARNPLLFQNEDLDKWIKELSGKSHKKKSVLLILNKSDLLTPNQRSVWVDYFKMNNINHVFWSAKSESTDVSNEPDLDESRILNRNQLLTYFKQLNPNKDDAKIVVGLVGYPNVGKSSTVNSILKAKKVSVSSTPGKTKHFQTHLVDENITLCDCPGLVFPSLIVSTSELIINGVLSVDRTHDLITPIKLIVSKIPRKVFEKTYGIEIRSLNKNEFINEEELLSVLAYNRGFKNFHGQSDVSRASKIILKDFTKGTKYVFCNPPPNYVQSNVEFNDQFNEISSNETPLNKDKVIISNRIISNSNIETAPYVGDKQLDSNFFNVVSEVKIIKKGSKEILKLDGSTQLQTKLAKKTRNKPREKLRRIYDQ